VSLHNPDVSYFSHVGVVLRKPPLVVLNVIFVCVFRKFSNSAFVVACVYEGGLFLPSFVYIPIVSFYFLSSHRGLQFFSLLYPLCSAIILMVFSSLGVNYVV
jgi:hypothetical protein